MKKAASWKVIKIEPRKGELFMENILITDKLTSKETNFIIGISFILALRQFGMMLVVPFISKYGLSLTGNTSALIGISLGIYGLAQGCLQIPYGTISDRVGRKPVIIFGILLQLSGFIVAYYARSIYIFILARALQGSGAINSVALSWLGDNIDVNKCNRAMRIVSNVSSLAIALSLIGGALLQKILSIPQIFLLCFFLSLIACLYIIFILRDNKKPRLNLNNDDSINNQYSIKDVMLNKQLLRLYGTGAISNFLLTGLFFILPHIIEKTIGSDGMWKILVPAIPIVFVTMMVVNKFADGGKTSFIQIGIFACFSVSVPCMFIENSIATFACSIIIFVGIMCQVYLVTSGVNRAADERYRGTINGVSNTIQYIGSFLGGALTGIFWGIGMQSTIIMMVAVCFSGLIIAITGINRN